MNKALSIALGVTFLGAATVGYGLYRLGTTYYDFGGAASELDKAAAAYRADGLPFLAQEVAPPHLVPERNAAPAIQAAIKALPKKGGTDLSTSLKNPGANADAVAARYAPALEIVEGVVDRPRVDYGRDWDLGPYMLFPEYASQKTLAKAAVLRADRAAARGDDAAALRDLTAARQLGVWAGQEPTLISLLVRIAIESIALDGAERCLVHVADRPERIARYRRWLATAPPLPRFGDALRGEAWFGLASIRNLDVFGGIETMTRMSSGDDDDGAFPKIDPAKLRRSGYPEDTRARGFMARHMQIWDEAYRATDGFSQPPMKIGAKMDEISSRLEAEKGLSFVLERIMLPVFAQAGQAVVRLESKRAVELGFSEALTTHSLTHRWPTKVAGIDPFTNGPLHVKQTADGIRVYGVDKDGKDDGGLHRREAAKLKRKTFDDVAAYPRVP